MHYYRARFYDAKLGRFISEDPIGLAGGINQFGYVGGNPVGYKDPSGRIAVLAAVWLVVEAGLTIYDIYDFGSTLFDSCSDWRDIVFSGTGLAIGAVLPGGGYGAGLKGIRKTLAGASNVTDASRSLKVASEIAPEISTVANKADEYVDLASPQRRRHILDGDATGGGHRPGTGKPGKSEFPQGWSDDKIMHEISDIATDPSAVVRAGRGGRKIADGTRDGIDIRVILERNGDIVSGFATNVPRNPK